MKITRNVDLAGMEKALGVKLIANGKGTQALHDAVVGYQANRRAGTRGTLTKATVNLSGSKPWRQKGTGRARAGYAASPVWRGGGVVFGPQPRDFSKKISKKTKKAALKKALSELSKQSRIHVVSAFELKAPKTRELAKLIQGAKLPESLAIVTKEKNAMLVLAGRNLPKVDIFEANQVNAEDLIRRAEVLIVEDALPVLAKRLA
ncbi:MAG: 50S ribosomal protein L4 [Verrucomicrobiota bacterium]